MFRTYCMLWPLCGKRECRVDCSPLVVMSVCSCSSSCPEGGVDYRYGTAAGLGARLVKLEKGRRGDDVGEVASL